jgi:hypothetical protein
LFRARFVDLGFIPGRERPGSVRAANRLKNLLKFPRPETPKLAFRNRVI